MKELPVVRANGVSLAVPHRVGRALRRGFGRADQTCDMCEAVTFDSPLHVEHPAYQEQLGVGCVCAENMSEDKVGPEAK